MNLGDLKLGFALQLLLKTTPILLIRLGVMLLFWLVAAIYLLITGSIAFLIGSAVSWLGVILFIIALGSVVPFYNLAYRYVFYMIKAAHIAVMAELLTNEKIKLPPGRGQLEWGKKQVEARFGEMNAMFVVDELVQGVVRAFTRSVYNIARWLPGDTMETLARVINRVIVNATNYIDEAVLARSFWQDDEVDIWENARDGVVLYAMSWKPILMASVALMFISYIPSIAAFLLLAAPIGAIIAMINVQLAGWTLIFLLLLAWVIKVAVGDAFAVAAMISTYHRETVGEIPDPQMAAKLDSISDAFGDLKQRAMDGFQNNSNNPMGKMPGFGSPTPNADAPITDIR